MTEHTPQDSQDTQTKLEAKIAFMERHIEQQDREMYKQSEILEKLVKEFKTLKEGLENQGEQAHNEKPPHY